MYYLESTKTDPSWNLALEQYVFDVLGPRDDCFMLWQNDNTIVVGKHQNTLEEIRESLGDSGKNDAFFGRVDCLLTEMEELTENFKRM